MQATYIDCTVKIEYLKLENYIWPLYDNICSSCDTKGSVYTLLLV